MIRLAALAAIVVVLGGCDSPASAETPDAGIRVAERKGLSFDYGINVVHDEKRAVTCWVFVASQKGGISCIPDSQLEPKP